MPYLLRSLLIAASLMPVGVFAGLAPPIAPDTGAVPVSSAYDDGYREGFAAGRLAGREDCRANPAGCAINLTNVLPPAQYGETEPNDHLISADPLFFDVNFWGQSASPSDQDWFYLVTAEPNTNLTFDFALPEASENDLKGRWDISVRNAAGIPLAQFDTGFFSVEHALSGVTYRVTLGLTGTYYVVVKPVAGAFSPKSYTLATNLRPSPLKDTPNYAGGFFDAEIEPNNSPAEATWIRRGVTVFGLINLRFDAARCTDKQCVYLQDENDWYLYPSPGNEIVQLSFCDRVQCPSGQWFVQIFDAATADAIQHHGLDPDIAKPLMAFNTEIRATDSDPAHVWTLGLRAPGTYFMRVGHKRSFNAPCIEWALDLDNNGIPDQPRGSCACASEPICTKKILNPQPPVIASVKKVQWPVCPNGTGGGTEETAAYCDTACVCINANCTLYQTDDNGDGLPGPNPQPCRCVTGEPSCALKVPNPGTPKIIEVPDQTVYPLCPDGSGGKEDPQCTAGCVCTETSGEVLLPSADQDKPTYMTSQYNFTWNSSPF